MTTMKNSNEHINDESKLKLDMSNSFAVPKISNNKLEEKDEDCNRSSFDAQDTMKNSSDCSLSIGTKSAVSNEEMIQRLISNVIDKSGTQEAVDLAQRKDVVNKTILRIVRRFYIQSFKEMFAKKFKSKEATES